MILYLLVQTIGFTLFLIFILLFNKKYNYFSKENIFYSYILFLLFFFIFAKIGYILIKLDFGFSKYFLSDDLVNFLNTIVSGFAFIGGYFGCLFFILFASKVFKWEMRKIMALYIPNMLLFYSILKVGCYINGCCGGKFIIPIQLIESFSNFVAYIYIYYLFCKNSNNKEIVYKSIILFGVLRLIISLFRIYSHFYTLILVEILCGIIILLGLFIRKKIN